MTDFLDLLFEYRLLRSKEEHLQILLDDHEVTRIHGIENMLRGKSVIGDARRAMPRLMCPRSVQFTMPGRFGAGEIANISGGGAAITTTETLRVGDRTIVRIAAPETGIEYVFPCRVVWTTSARQGNVGIAFDGVPSQTQIAKRPSQAFRRLAA